MIVIPAVDIKNGKCVRLSQGRMDAETVFSDDPAAMALKWDAVGVDIIHVIDLDGAIHKRPKNKEAIRNILTTVRARVQVCGGIRNLKTIEDYLQMGVHRIIIGTEAIRNPQFVKEACRLFPGHIVVGIDARNGLVAIEGWTEITGTRAVDLALQLEDQGVAAINFTDIHRDGMQTGPNIEETRKLAESISIPVVASGGVSTLQDIRNLLPLESSGVVGVITGKALYTGSLNLAEAVSLATGVSP
ncbi:MAG: 1-(5-phosphoribosyl)-5-[(5-phosphoribosylamino)methylideneamino]imidazole-4-carboxamide isomerase [Deltaproteobacteria bacterium]|jgi:phosphoribosylformimino-5-aminoimidazole carboxamide ribotide isomerase|nr:1-(5-phosphoribosyl)-5-[(5-phosphoribosylamino)methylideneamino]imidazole-4-carboxamide isomerase [Deltaproteobacteria bacterium]